jgi:hypothetical protein
MNGNNLARFRDGTMVGLGIDEAEHILAIRAHHCFVSLRHSHIDL